MTSMSELEFISLWLDHIPPEKSPLFLFNIRQLVETAWLRGERYGTDYPRGEGR